MSFFLSKLFGTRPNLFTLERMILDSVRSGLDENSVKYWDMQVESINKIQRLPKGIEVDFYRMKKGKPSFDENISFRNKTKELKIAKVYISSPGIGETLLAEVWCVSGFLSSIEYDTDPAYFLEAACVEPAPQLLLRLNLIENLSVSVI